MTSTAELTEIAHNQNWRARIDAEVGSQLRYASDWGSIRDDKPPATIEEQIAAKKAELAELKARVKDSGTFATTSKTLGTGEDLEVFRWKKK